MVMAHHGCRRIFSFSSKTSLKAGRETREVLDWISLEPLMTPALEKPGMAGPAKDSSVAQTNWLKIDINY